MAELLVVDPLLVTEEFGIDASWAGSEHHVTVPDGWTLERLAPHLPTADALLTAHAPVTAEMLALAPNLRLVAKPGAGVDNIDVPAATSRGVVVTNVTGARSRAVAEHALFMMLYLARHAWMRDDPAWRGTTSVQLGGKTLGIVGLGAIGLDLARSCHGIGMRVVAHTRTPDRERPGAVPVDFLERVELLARSDFVVLTLPLTAETRHLIDADALASMKPTAFLVNVSRGPIVATDDLVAAMRDGRIAGAGLDVTEPEPLPADHELRRFPNVLISPHNAGRTHESQAEALDRMRTNVRLVLSGEPPIDPVTA